MRRNNTVSALGNAWELIPGDEARATATAMLSSWRSRQRRQIFSSAGLSTVLRRPRGGYNGSMAGQLFDVFVVGSADPSPAGVTRLASALSSKHGVALATVAKAISAKNLRAGQSLDQAQAQALVRQLQGMGGVTVIRPAAGAPRASAQMLSQTGRSLAVPTPPAIAMSRGDRQAAPPAPGVSALAAAPGFGPPLVAPADPASGRGALTPLQSSAAQASSGLGSQPGQSPSQPGADAFAPPNMVTPRPTSGAWLAPPPVGSPTGRSRTARTPPPVSQHSSPVPGTDALRASPVPGTDVFHDDVSSGPRLELARGDSNRPSDDAVPARATPTAGNLRDIGAMGASGIAMDEDPRSLNLVRCAQHGLYYDKTKASGCRKCMSLAREVAMGFESRNAPASIKVANLRDQPAKRAFIGLGVAWLLGLLPAAYYAFGPGAADARELRVRQEVLSRQPGTSDVLRQFDDLDGQVNRTRTSSARNIALVWAATSMAAMAGWYKVT
jgi:hypothetical protein